MAAGLEQDGLSLVADVKVAYAEYTLALDRIVLAERALGELQSIATLMDSRFQAGDISQLEARTASIDAARARQDSSARDWTPTSVATSSVRGSVCRSKPSTRCRRSVPCPWRHATSHRRS